MRTRNPCNDTTATHNHAPPTYRGSWDGVYCWPTNTRALFHGWIEGALRGQPGNIDLRGVNCDALKAAVAKAESLRVMSDRTRQLLASAAIILRVRHSMLHNDSQGVRKVRCCVLWHECACSAIICRQPHCHALSPV